MMQVPTFNIRIDVFDTAAENNIAPRNIWFYLEIHASNMRLKQY